MESPVDIFCIALKWGKVDFQHALEFIAKIRIIFYLCGKMEKDGDSLIYTSWFAGR